MTKKMIFIIVLIILSTVVGIKKASSIKGDRVHKDINEMTISTNSENIEKSDIEKKDNKREQVKTFNQNLILVNKENRLNKEHCLKNLTIPHIKFISSIDPGVRKMQKEAAEALEKLFNAANSHNIVLMGVSGYRDYFYQEKLYNNKVDKDGKEEADKVIAPPGASEHETGLAMDIATDNGSILEEGFESTEAGKWVKENCYKYGFIIRYPKGKEKITGYSFEPWHLRYVGNEAAKEINEKGITLEEYLNLNNFNK